MAALGGLKRMVGTSWETMGHFLVTVDAETQLPLLPTPERGMFVHCANEKTLWVHDGTSFTNVSASGTAIKTYDPATAFPAGSFALHNAQIWRAKVDVPATDAVAGTTSVEPAYLATAQWEVLQRPVLHIQTSATAIDAPAAIPGDFYFDTDTKDFGFLSPHQPDANDQTLVVFGAGGVPAAVTDLATLRQDAAHGSTARAGTAAFPVEHYITIGTVHYTWDGVNWQVYGGAVDPGGLHRNSGLNENTIRQWIAESSRFRGALMADGSHLVGAISVKQLPTAAAMNAAQYWVASEEIPNPLPGVGSYEDKTIDLLAAMPASTATAPQVHALTSIAALEALIPAATLPAAWKTDWRTKGWLLEMGGIKAVCTGTAWQQITTLDTLKSGDWLQSVGDPAQGVRGFVRIPGGTLTISLADSRYVQQNSPRALPLATKNDQRLRSVVGQVPRWEDVPPTSDQAIKRVLVNTKTANNEVAWSGLWPTHDVHQGLQTTGNWHWRDTQAPFPLGVHTLIDPANPPAAQGEMSLSATELKVHVKDESGTDRSIVLMAMIPSNAIVVQGIDTARASYFKIGAAPARTGDVVTFTGTLYGPSTVVPGRFTAVAINPNAVDDGAVSILGPVLRVTEADEDGWMGAQFGGQPPMPGTGSMIKAVEQGDAGNYGVYEAQLVVRRGDYLDIVFDPGVRYGASGRFIVRDGLTISFGVDPNPVQTVTDVRPGEYLLVGDPGRLPTGSGPDQGKQASSGDLLQALDRDKNGVIDGYKLLSKDTPTGVMKMVGIIDGVGAETHTWKWDEIGIPMDYNPPPSQDVGQFNFVNNPPSSPANSAHWDKAAKTIAFWHVAADTSTAVQNLPSVVVPNKTVLYVGGRSTGNRTFLLSKAVASGNGDVITVTYVGEPVGSATDPGGLEHIAWAVLDGEVNSFVPNSYLMVDDVPASKTVPAGVPGAQGKDVGIGDWLVAVDTDGDGLSDTWHLLHHTAPQSSSIFNLVSDGAADHRTLWSLTDLMDATKVPVNSWIVVSDAVSETAPATMSWVDVDGNDYVFQGVIAPPRGSLVQKMSATQFKERWRPEQPWYLHVTDPHRPFHAAYTAFTGHNWDWYRVGQPYIVAETDAQGMLPALNGKFPSMISQPARVGDAIVPIDKNNDGVADDAVLVRQQPTPVMHTHFPNEATPATTGYILFERFKGDTKTVVLNNPWVKGRWDFFIKGQCRSDTDLYLNFHTDGFGAYPSDSPVQNRRTPALKSLGPWAVKAGMPFSIHITGICEAYSFWQIVFSGQGPDGSRIFDITTLEDGSGGARLPIIGVDCDAGGIYTRCMTTHTPGDW